MDKAGGLAEYNISGLDLSGDSSWLAEFSVDTLIDNHEGSLSSISGVENGILFPQDHGNDGTNWSPSTFHPPSGIVHGHQPYSPINEAGQDVAQGHSESSLSAQVPIEASGSVSQQRQERQQRLLPRQRSKYILRRSGSRTRAIAIPTTSGNHDESQSLVMQRWQDSPPEDEAASLSAIYGALKGQPRNTSPFSNPTTSSRNLHTFRANSSTTSLDSGASLSSKQSGDSEQSAASANSRASESRRMRSRMKRNKKSKNHALSIFKCTFCCDSFKRKYDWVRHEKSLHLSMEEWRCAPIGPSIVNPVTTRVHCAYCGILDPTADHHEQHNHTACQAEETARPTFRRKDHLVQHLRHVHDLETSPFVDAWKAELGRITSRCGFCNNTFSSWDERSDHLASHFRKGKTMADWKGEHGFEPHIAARVTNSMAPYLIASESISLVPYSATNPNSMDLFNQISSQINRLGSAQSASQDLPEVMPTAGSNVNSEQQPGPASHSQTPTAQQEIDTIVFTEVLTRHLSQFARQQMAMGVVPTDEMFQRESRRVLYDGDEDDWNQTVADHPDWLASFRQRYGLQNQEKG